jgi:hypothetical protein
MRNSIGSPSVESSRCWSGSVRFQSGDTDTDAAWRVAVGDLAGNVVPFKDGLLERPHPVILAGLDYDTPWTRDAAINVWNAGPVIPPAVARSTMLSVLERTGDGIRIGGQYWDAVIWIPAAWYGYLVHGDRRFLGTAYQAAVCSLRYFCETEYDAHLGLFRGPAVYGDGVAAYPDRYVPASGRSCILDWAVEHRDRSLPGQGIPMFALSTNCVYIAAYETVARMERALGYRENPRWRRMARALRSAVYASFYDAARRRLRYLVDAQGGCQRQEALGVAFAVLFDVIPRRDRTALIRGVRVTPQGIACVWPTYSRYRGAGPGAPYGRHSGTVWPHAQGFWASVCAREKLVDAFDREFRPLARNISRDAQCAEIYHPVSGLPYGGRQENGGRGITVWPSCRRQTWSATAFLRMCMEGLVGIRITEDGMRFAPCVPPRFSRIELDGIRYRRMTVDICVEGSGVRVASCTIDGRRGSLLPPDGRGRRKVLVRMRHVGGRRR